MIFGVWLFTRCFIAHHPLVYWRQETQSWECECGHRSEKGWDFIKGGNW